MFQSLRGKPIETSNFANRDWPGILSRAEVPWRRAYQTRHTAATPILAEGEEPQWIAHVLGHASCQMLWQFYSRYVPNFTRNDGAAFKAKLGQLASLAPRERLASAALSSPCVFSSSTGRAIASNRS